MDKKEFIDFMINNSSFITVGKYLDVRVQMAIDSWGYDTLGHKEALMAKEMYEQICSYIENLDIKDVTFHKIHERLKQENEEE
ncbi:MAG: hypothetical protein Q4A15_06850 [Prevotellaceae bacterium]|nr:hypothetical protein [Prevotellaceae bacterium]